MEDMMQENEGQLQAVLDTVGEELEAQDQEQEREVNDSREYDEERAAKKQPSESFRELREQKKKAEEERDYLARQIAELTAQRKQQAAMPDEDELVFEGDDYAERTDLKKLQGSLDRKIKAVDRKLYEISVENQIRSEYNDYYKVVNIETLRLLAQKKPALARVLARSTDDLYDQAVAAYDAVKEYVLNSTQPVERIQKRAQENLKKPALAPQAPTAPGSFAFADQIMNGDITPELENFLRDEIERNARKRNF